MSLYCSWSVVIVEASRLNTDVVSFGNCSVYDESCLHTHTNAHKHTHTERERERERERDARTHRKREGDVLYHVSEYGLWHFLF